MMYSIIPLTYKIILYVTFVCWHLHQMHMPNLCERDGLPVNTFDNVRAKQFISHLLFLTLQLGSQLFHN